MSFLVIDIWTPKDILGQRNNTTSSSQEEQNQILCNELAILNSLVQDTEVLPSTAAGNSTSEQECGFKPNIVP